MTGVDYSEIEGVRYRLPSADFPDVLDNEDWCRVKIYRQGFRQPERVVYFPKSENIFILLNHWNRESSPNYLFYV